MRVVLIAVATLVVGLGLVGSPWLEIVGWATLLVGGWHVWREAFENVAERRMTMELSMTIAIVAAAAIGELFTALIITGFVLVAEILEEMTVDRGHRAIADLLDTLPRTVTVRSGDGFETVEVASLEPGAVVFVEPGAMIPVDGSVISGSSFVNQSAVTGESMPVEKSAGDAVFAGTVNHAGSLEITVERLGEDTTYGRIIESLGDLETSRAPVQRLSDRIAGYLVYFALTAAAVTFLVTGDITATIAVIIVAGACGVAAGTPLAILGGIGRAALGGAILKGGVHLETLSKVDTVVLDKTGTLTFGQPQITAVLPLNDTDPTVLLAAAATAELRSEHPIAKAIVSYADQMGVPVIEPDTFSYSPGEGVIVTSAGSRTVAGSRDLIAKHLPGTELPDLNQLPVEATHAYIACNQTLLGVIAVADTIRSDATESIAALKQRGLHTILLTGDNATIAQAIGTQLGITTIEGALLPDDKLARINQLVSDGRIVAMVGDGINDAPALAAAQVGIAMGSGTIVAHETSDVILIGNDLTKLVDTIDIARKARRTIHQNLAGTIGIDIIGIALAATGLLTPILAAFVHVTSELAFLLNSARLLPPRHRKKPPRIQRSR